MNTFQEERRKQLAAILQDENVPASARLDKAAELLERELKRAFTRGVRQRRKDGDQVEAPPSA